MSDDETVLVSRRYLSQVDTYHLPREDVPGKPRCRNSALFEWRPMSLEELPEGLELCKTCDPDHEIDPANRGAELAARLSDENTTPEDLGLSSTGERGPIPDGGELEDDPYLRTTISSPESYWFEVHPDGDGEGAFYRLVAVDAHRDDIRVAKGLLDEWLDEEREEGDTDDGEWSTVYDGVREDSDGDGWSYSEGNLSRGVVSDESAEPPRGGGA